MSRWDSRHRFPDLFSALMAQWALSNEAHIWMSPNGSLHTERSDVQLLPCARYFPPLYGGAHAVGKVKPVCANVLPVARAYGITQHRRLGVLGLHWDTASWASGNDKGGKQFGFKSSAWASGVSRMYRRLHHEHMAGPSLSGEV